MQSMDDSTVVAPPHLGRPLRLLPFRGLGLSARRIGDPAVIGALTRPYRGSDPRVSARERGGRLWRDRRTALYVHEYAVDGLTVRGLVGALDLTHRAGPVERQAVLPHEGVHPPQVDSLAKRMRRSPLIPAPILLVHRGPQQVRDLLVTLTATAPVRTVTDRFGQEHRLWAIRDDDAVGDLQGWLEDASPVLADGHHRYSAALRLQAERPGTPWDRGLAMLVDQDDTPLFLGAIHRVLRQLRLGEVEQAAARAQRWSFARQPTDAAALAQLAPDTLVLTDGPAWATLSLDLDPGAAAVEALHQAVLPDLGTTPTVGYHHRVAEALAAVRPKRDVAVLMPAPGYDLVHDIVASGRLLPEKATSFQPKPAHGVLMRSMRDG